MAKAFLEDMTNEQLKACLLDDMESLRKDADKVWVPDDDSVDATISVIEEVFRRIDVYSNKRNETRPQIDWQCDRGICEYSDRINGQCQCYNEENNQRGDIQ